MKTKLTTSLILLLAVICYLISGSTEHRTVNNAFNMPMTGGGDNFVIGALDNGLDTGFNYVPGTLGFNLWHLYTGLDTDAAGRSYPTGWVYQAYAPGDTLFAGKINYVSQVQGVLGDIKNQNMTALMMRPKIEWLCYGQRSDYQCENTSDTSDLWFYSFNDTIAGRNIQDTSQYGSDEMVRYCEVDPHQTDGGANWVVKRLKANTEQCQDEDHYIADGECTWYIKPRIRIDSNVAHNPQNPPVCKIKVIKEDGSTVLKEVIIKANNFLDENENYNGSYIEEYNFPGDTNLRIQGAWGESWKFSARGNSPNDSGVNKADIQVYWYGNCDMWIDYVRVDNDVADQLFKGVFETPTNNWLEWEARDIAGHLNGAASYRFYLDEFQYNNIPCMAYVNKKVDSISGGKVSLMCDLNYALYNVHLPYPPKLHASHIKKYLVEKIGLKEIFMGPYPFAGNSITDTTISKIPETLPVTYDSLILGRPVSPTEYETWLQDHLDKPSNPYTGEHDDGIFTYYQKLADTISKQSGIPYISLVQAHVWYGGNAPDAHRLREPTNEEQEMLVDVSICYGGQGLIYFWYDGHHRGDEDWGYGFTSGNNNLRILNAYGQAKKDTIAALNSKLKKWGPYIMSFNKSDRQTYRFQDATERNTLIQNTYFLNVKTFLPGTGHPSCNPADDTTGNSPLPEQSLTYDCPEHTYLQAALFNNSNDSYQYFMIVNRRCSPFLNGSSADSNGGRRFVRILFDANHSAFNGYNNWNIIDLEDEDNVVLTFDKTKTENLDLDWFMPGEGRLYKIVPLIPSGGTLVTNEVIDEDVNCGGMIYNNGYDITINHNKTLSFSEGAGIEMTGGSFFCGTDAGEVINITFKGLNGSRWNGITLDECDTVGIYCAKFEDVKQNKTGGGNNFALNLIDCYNFKIANNLFECKQDSAFGGINSVYISEHNDTIISYISENTFDMNNSPSPSVEIISSAGITTPLLLQWNEFSTTCDSSIAIIINSVVGGAIKNNTIEGYNKGINSLSSSIDIYENTIITSSFNDAIGILAVSGSTLNIGPNSAYLLGGYNIFSNTGTGTRNIEVVNSYFDVNEGENSFNISDNDPQTAYHFYGYFPEELEEGDEEATLNCFQLDSTENEANHDITWGEEGDNVTFIFDDNCGGGGGGQSGGLSSSGSNNYVVFYIGNGVTDTVYLRTYGTGTLYDSLCTDTRKRDYNSVITKCTELLNNYSDSTESLDAIAKLYTASLALDSSGSKMQPLKSFLETLILNNTGNTSLINRAFYFIQKCKVALELYKSALQGFQQIINQNQYSYEGLVASWDYAATYLLDSLYGGSGGGEEGVFFNDDDPNEKTSIDDDDPYDKQKFTKEDRKVIKTSVLTAFEKNNEKQVEKIRDLEKKSKSNDKAERDNAEKELKKMRVLKEVVKTKHPKNKIAYVKILNKDIQKVFGGGHKSDNLRGDNLIPTEFNLYQNYPNPFNPTTKIKYDLPKQGKVKLIIYDILGREIKRLINNELMPAGRHTVEFAGHNLASGVYFYQLEVDDGKEYLMTKKMVFIK